MSARDRLVAVTFAFLAAGLVVEVAAAYIATT